MDTDVRANINTVMAEYSQELKRTTGKECRFAHCGGGWYAIYLEGETASRRQRMQRRSIERALLVLRQRPTLAQP